MAPSLPRAAVELLLANSQEQQALWDRAFRAEVYEAAAFYGVKKTASSLDVAHPTPAPPSSQTLTEQAACVDESQDEPPGPSPATPTGPKPEPTASSPALPYVGGPTFRINSSLPRRQSANPGKGRGLGGIDVVDLVDDSDDSETFQMVSGVTAQELRAMDEPIPEPRCEAQDCNNEGEASCDRCDRTLCGHCVIPGTVLSAHRILCPQCVWDIQVDESLQPQPVGLGPPEFLTMEPAVTRICYFLKLKDSLRFSIATRQWAEVRNHAYLWMDCIEPKNKRMRRRPWTLNVRNVIFFKEPQVRQMMLPNPEIIQAPFGALSYTRQPVRWGEKAWPLLCNAGADPKASSEILVPLAYSRDWYKTARVLLAPDTVPGEERYARAYDQLDESVHYWWLAREPGVCAAHCVLKLAGCSRDCDRMWNHVTDHNVQGSTGIHICAACANQLTETLSDIEKEADFDPDAWREAAFIPSTQSFASVIEAAMGSPVLGEERLVDERLTRLISTLRTQGRLSTDHRDTTPCCLGTNRRYMPWGLSKGERIRRFPVDGPESADELLDEDNQGAWALADPSGFPPPEDNSIAEELSPEYWTDPELLGSDSSTDYEGPWCTMTNSDNSCTDIWGRCVEHGDRPARRCKACTQFQRLIRNQKRKKWKKWAKLPTWERDRCSNHDSFVPTCNRCSAFREEARNALDWASKVQLTPDSEPRPRVGRLEMEQWESTLEAKQGPEREKRARRARSSENTLNLSTEYQACSANCSAHSAWCTIECDLGKTDHHDWLGYKHLCQVCAKAIAWSKHDTGGGDFRCRMLCTRCSHGNHGQIYEDGLQVLACQLGTIGHSTFLGHKHMCLACTRRALGGDKCNAICGRCRITGGFGTCDAGIVDHHDVVNHFEHLCHPCWELYKTDVGAFQILPVQNKRLRLTDWADNPVPPGAVMLAQPYERSISYLGEVNELSSAELDRAIAHNEVQALLGQAEEAEREANKGTALTEVYAMNSSAEASSQSAWAASPLQSTGASPLQLDESYLWAEGVRATNIVADPEGSAHTRLPFLEPVVPTQTMDEYEDVYQDIGDSVGDR